MAHKTLCRLCVTNSEAVQSLYDDDGEKNEVYQLMVKFFDATHLNVEQGSRLTCMCLKCWCTICDFHHFQQSVVKAQKRLLEVDFQFKKHHVKTENLDSTGECTVFQIEEISVKSEEVLPHTLTVKHRNQYNNGVDNIHYEQRMSCIEPKLELMDVFSADDSTADKDDIFNDTGFTLMKNDFQSESEHNDGEFSSDDNALIDKEDEGNEGGVKENNVRKKVGIDDFIAHWRPNLECVVCLQLYPSFSLLQHHFRQNHSKDEFYILCCRRKLRDLYRITEHIRFHNHPNAIKCVLCNKSFPARSALDRHMDIQHAIPNEGNDVSNVDSTDNFQKDMASEEEVLSDTWNGGNFNQYSNSAHNIEEEQRKSIVLPKLELMDAFLGYDSIQDNDTGSTLMNNKIHLESDDNVGQFCSDDNALIEKGDYKSKFSIDDTSTAKPSFKKERNLRKKTRIDDFIAHWRPNLECVVCLQLYSSFSLLQQHFRQNHPQDEFYILCCRRKLKNHYKITEHIRFHIDPNAIKCFLCNKSFTARSSLDRHMDIYHVIPNEGNVVQNVDSTDNILSAKTSSKKQTERRTVQDFDEFIAKWMPKLECVICSETRSTFTLLQQHFREKHSQDQCYIQCCQRKFKNRSLLSEHVRLHFDPNTYMCEICKKSFGLRRSLLRHMHTHDDNSNVNLKKSLKNTTPKDEFIAQWKSNLECVVCSETCPTFTLLRQHFKHKHPLDEFYILCCHRKLKDRHHIKEHILLHIDPNSFKCELCNRCFNTRSHLLRHMRTYHPIFDDGLRKIPEGPRKTTKELDDVIALWKPVLECVLCRVTCANFALLQEHFRQEHPQEECYIVCCQRKMKERYRIIDHIRVHNDPNAYKCDLCNKCFTTRSNLHHHMRGHHSTFNTTDDT